MTPTGPQPQPYRLTPEEEQTLVGLQQQITQLQGGIAALKRAGLDVTQLQRNLNHVQSIRSGMLKHLAPSVPKAQP